MFLARTLLISLFLVGPALAQQPDTQQAPPNPPPAQNAPSEQQPGTNPPAAQPAPAPEKSPERDKDPQGTAQGTAQANDDQNKNAGTSKDRLFFTLPNFLTLENAGQVPPLSAGEKFRVQVRSTFDYVEFPWWGVLAAIGQAQNSSSYGQGWGAYGSRYGTTAADSIIENFMTAAVMASVLRQDPRFFQKGKGSFWHRTSYAVSRVWRTRSDSGHSQINYSEILGSAIAAGISNYSYHPHDEKNLGNTAQTWGTQVGLDAITYVVKEFWPDIRRKVRHEKLDAGSPVVNPRAPSPASN